MQTSGTEVKSKTMHTLIPKEAHLPYRREKNPFENQFIKNCDTEKASFCKALLLPIRKNHIPCVGACLGAWFHFRFCGRKRNHEPHKWNYSHPSAIILNALWSHSTWAQSGPIYILLHATFQHLWLFTVCYATRIMLSQHSEIVNRKRSEPQQICKHTPEMKLSKKQCRNSASVVFIYLFIWGYLLYLTDICIKILNALLIIQTV